VRSRRWKWIGLGAVAAIAAGTALAAERRRRRWREYDTDDIRTRLHERFDALEQQPREELEAPLPAPGRAAGHVAVDP
jgi:hypothetical protein